MRRALGLAVVCGIGAAAAHAAAPLLPRGKSVVVYVQVTPALSWFADPVTVRVTAFVANAKVRPESVRAAVKVRPFKLTGAARPPDRTEMGPVTRLTWKLDLQCMTQACVGSAPNCQSLPCILPPTQKYLLGSGRLSYELRNARRPKRSFRFRGTSIVVASRVVATPFDKSNELPTIYKSHLWPVASPRYRISPWLAAGIAAGLALLLAAAAGILLWRIGQRRRAARQPQPAPVRSPLEEALATLAWARRHGTEAERRKALERLAVELQGRNGLADVALELAWSEPSPPDDELVALSLRVREETAT